MDRWDWDRLSQLLATAREHVFPAGWDGLGLVIVVIGAQVVLIVLLLAYALALRIRRRMAEARRRQLYTIWHYLVPAFLSGDIDEEYLHHSLRRRDYPLFAEFLRPYLADLAGSDTARLSALLQRLGFTAYLRRGLSHRNPWRRAYAVHFFALIADRGAAPLIRHALDDPSELVALQAAEGLMRLRDFGSIEAVLRRLSGFTGVNRERIAVYLMEFGVQGLPVLQGIVRDGAAPPWLHLVALQVLGYHHYTPATWDILYLYLHTQHREVRIACVKTLVATNEPTLVGFFEEMLRDRDPVVRAEGAQAIGVMGEASHARMLAPLLQSDDFWVLKHSIDALLRLDMLPWVLLHPGYGRERFSPKAWALIREVLTEQRLRRGAGLVA